MYELMTLSGREYVDVYAQKVKEGAVVPPIAAAPAPATASRAAA
jgi:hypothetical protein